MPSGKHAKVTKVVHVDSKVVRSNRCKDAGGRKPPIIARKSRSAAGDRVWWVPIYDAEGRVVARVVYEPDQPLKCGAVVYVECYCPDPVSAAAKRAQSTRARASRTGRTP